MRPVSAARTFPFRSGKFFSVKTGLGGYICVQMLEKGGFGGRGGAAMVLLWILIHNRDSYSIVVSIVSKFW